MPANIKVCAITVTYGNRWHLVEQVIAALKNQTVNVNQIIVVDNGSVSNKTFKSFNNPNINIMKLDRNRGSAAGYKVGLKRAYQTDCDLIWLLDDDNKPHSDALEKLLAARKCLGDNENDCFAAMRLDREKYLNVVYDNKSLKLKYNTFMGYSLERIYRIFPIILELLTKKKNKPSKDKLINPIKRIEYAIFGGLLFSKKWLERIGYPDERYFLYIDDVDYTTRIVRGGGNIYLVASSIVEDIDKSWFISQQGSHFTQFFDLKIDEKKIYYAVRNNVYLRNKYFVKNKLLYYLNMAFYFLVINELMFLVACFENKSVVSTFQRLILLISAIKDGVTERLGYKEFKTKTKQ